MDGINQINGIQGIPSPMDQNSKQIWNPEDQGKQPPPPPFNVQLTQLGQLFSAVEELGDSAKNELKQFHENLFAALKTGSFDAEALAENASDEIKDFAAKSGRGLDRV